MSWSKDHNKDYHNGIQIDLNVVRKGRRCYLRECCNSDEEVFTLKRVTFQNLSVFIPQKDEFILKKFYGNIDVPPVTERRHHQGKAAFFAPDWVKKKYPKLYQTK